MTQEERIARINALAAKAKAGTLTAEETAERENSGRNIWRISAPASGPGWITPGWWGPTAPSGNWSGNKRNNKSNKK